MKRFEENPALFVVLGMALCFFFILSLIGIDRALGADAAIWTAAGIAGAIAGVCFYFAWK